MAKNHPSHIILGTAGHIDHGKSTLVKALTGTDPDRLKEEKERGITIDLGFAHIAYPDGLTVGIVDVPGHERLIKNMLAGAGGIDMVLFVVDAEEGIMPQTKEHLAICQLLGLNKGIFALTKADLVEGEWLFMVMEELKGFLESTSFQNAPVLPVSGITGYNIEELKEAIHKIALTVNPKPVDSLFRLPVDRVFTLRGHGTVVTGTAISGQIYVNDIIEILPAQIKGKVRGLHVHGMEVQTAQAGQRVAVNIPGIEKETVQRGYVLAMPGVLKLFTKIDCTVNFLEDGPTLKSGSKVHFHTGTQEQVARMVLYEEKEIRPGQKSRCQFRFSTPVVVMAGDHFIIRRFSPLQTIGGGVVLDPWPSKIKKKDRIADLEILERKELKEKLAVKIKRLGLWGISRQSLKGWIRTTYQQLESAIYRLINNGVVISQNDRLLHQRVFEDFSINIINTLKTYHQENPLRHGMPKEALKSVFRHIDAKWFSQILGKVEGITVEGNLVRLKSFRVSITDDENDLNTRILELLQKNHFQPPFRDELVELLEIDKKQVTDRLNYLTTQGTLVRMNDNLFLTSQAYKTMLNLLKEFFVSHTEITVSEFRDILNTTRRYALPFFEYLDSHKITLRVGDRRKLFKIS